MYNALGSSTTSLLQALQALYYRPGGGGGMQCNIFVSQILCEILCAICSLFLRICTGICEGLPLLNGTMPKDLVNDSWSPMEVAQLLKWFGLVFRVGVAFNGV